MVPEMSSTKDISTAWIRNVMTKPTGDAVLRPDPDVADTTVTGSKPHTHPPTPVENSAHTAKQTLKRKAAETDLPTKHIVADAVGPLSFEAMDKMNCETSSLAKRARTAANRHPISPKLSKTWSFLQTTLQQRGNLSSLRLLIQHRERVLYAHAV